ncbi:helix-turn-helix DNA-binding domain protein [Streptomyces phage Frankenweenie]|nr:helix-turn-helix DNA-binding domain protein [Streptomyces phage Frankenweenie]
MERPKKSNVRHGMASCGRYGCERTECKEAYYRSQKLSRIGQERGESARVPADEARAHGKLLTEAGMFVTDIARLAGVSRSIVGQVISGRVARIHRDTAAAILGVPVPRKEFVGCDGIVPALTAQRRIRALSRRGFSLKVMAREMNASVFTIDSIRNGNRVRIRASMDQAIHAAYNRLWNVDPLSLGVTPGGVTQARNWAIEQEWPPPAAWDDDTIGDPKAKPKGMLPKDRDEIGA